MFFKYQGQDLFISNRAALEDLRNKGVYALITERVRRRPDGNDEGVVAIFGDRLKAQLAISHLGAQRKSELTIRSLDDILACYSPITAETSAPDKAPDCIAEGGPFYVVISRPAIRLGKASLPPLYVPSEQAARLEAEKLARENPNEEFFIFEPIASVTLKDPKWRQIKPIILSTAEIKMDFQ